MRTPDWFNIARCADLRAEQLWDSTVQASRSNGNWKPLLDQRWREHTTYLAATRMARTTWRRENGLPLTY